MRLSWLIQRLSKMTPQEIVQRGRDRYAQWQWRSCQVKQGEAEVDIPVAHRASALVPLPPAEDLVVPAGGRMQLLAAADMLLDGRWPVFDRLRQDMMPAPDWFLDPRTGRRSPSNSYAFDINVRQEEKVGNIKYVWELSRHHHLTMLATAFYLTGDERYARVVAEHLRSWWKANPFLSGVHWTSGIEVGLRLIAWVWIRRLLAAWPHAGELFEDNPRFLLQLYHHQQYLAHFHSHGSSANNHLLAEAAGQFAAGCYFPCFDCSDQWRDSAAEVLRREIPRQTFPGGLNRELATGYHGFVLEFCLAAALEGEAAGCSLGTTVWETLRRMFDALAAMVDVRGRPPRQGDDDDGLGLLLDAPESFDRWNSLLAMGEGLFGRCNWWPPVRHHDVRTPVWLSVAAAPPLPDNRPSSRPNQFSHAGMVILRDRADRDDEIWCRVDGGPHGYLAIAAHAHADALALEVRFGGVDILADPGTYCYHGEPHWRTLFRGTAGHNTLELAGHPQSSMGGPFLWTRQATSQIHELRGLDSGSVAECHAWHDGYRRTRLSGLHHRKVTLDRTAHRLRVDDWIDDRRGVECRLMYHLGPTVECQLRGNEAELSWVDGQQHRSACLTLPPALAWQSVRGQIDPPLGWYSAAFDRKQPTTTLVGSGTISSDTHLLSELQFLGDLPTPREHTEVAADAVVANAQ